MRERRSPDRVPSGPSLRDSRSPDRVRSCSSRAVSPVAGHGVGNGRRVPYRPSPDRVPSGSSRAVSPVAGSRAESLPPDYVSSCAVVSVAGSCAVGSVARSRVVMSRPVSATSCLCRVHGRASHRSVVCHVSAPQRREPTPPPAVYERLFFCMAVAFNECAFGGAAKRNRWAALTPTHRAEPSEQPERPRTTTHQWI